MGDGPQHFADVRRNVAVLEVWDAVTGTRVLNDYAVSGVDGPGTRPDAASRAMFIAQEVEDGLGETYARDYDAEFKLCASFCSAFPTGHMPTRPFRAMLFSKKPLCVSCSDVVF